MSRDSHQKANRRLADIQAAIRRASRWYGAAPRHARAARPARTSRPAPARTAAASAGTDRTTS